MSGANWSAISNVSKRQDIEIPNALPTLLSVTNNMQNRTHLEPLGVCVYACEYVHAWTERACMQMCL